jgi:hypothetical protein
VGPVPNVGGTPAVPADATSAVPQNGTPAAGRLPDGFFLRSSGFLIKSNAFVFFCYGLVSQARPNVLRRYFLRSALGVSGKQLQSWS